MSNEKNEPSYDAARRIRWLGYCVVIAIVLATIGWFSVAALIENRMSDAIEKARQSGTDISCTDRAVRGYPFRFGVFCEQVTAERAAGDFVLELGALRSAAQFYNLRHAIVELDGPANMTAKGQTATLDFELARASIVQAPPLPQRISVEMTAPQLSISGQKLISGDMLTAHWRALERDAPSDDLDIAARLTALKPSDNFTLGRSWPLVDLDADLTITNGTIRVAQMVTQDPSAGPLTGTIRRLGLSLTNDSGVLLEGPFSLNQEKQISGEWTIRIIDAATVLATLKTAAPAMSTPLAIIDAMPRSGASADEIEFKITIREGQVFLGLIPIGTIPPLR